MALLLPIIALLLLLSCSPRTAQRIIGESQDPLLIHQVSSDEPSLNFRPLIGILSQPGDGNGGIIIKRKGWNRFNVSYIAASYVKFVEMGGARAVPLIYNEPEDVLLRKFAAINGILFPGGSASLKDGPFYQTAEKLFKMALEENDKGDYFPVFGTCLGFELLCIIVTQDHNVLERFSAMYHPAPLHFSSEWAKQRNMFKWFPSKVIENVEKDNLTMENHKFGISPENFSSNCKLSSFFRVLTTSPDREMKTYVSTVEGRKYPVTGVQWHPEKNAFEWGVSSIPHSEDAIQLCQSVANFLVSEARKSYHKPSQDEEDEFLIFNYTPFFTGKHGEGHYDQSYIFFQS